ncbi:hypothetical protein VPNG_05244 [Cytospora leucostoma]|uniref:Myb-like domain-containing protein n=1 Tax=Cytospora leucostoma TaxID=1230097 RepID=A0A423X7R8_9PEZI|nr:hypothetical protein VPNG_05244 [Cytospora leucostoma]
MANPLQYQVHDSDDNDDPSYSGTSSPVITSPASPTRSFSPAWAGVPSYAQGSWPNISPSSSPELGYGSTYASAYNPMSASLTMGSMNLPTGAMGPPPRPSATDSTQSIHQGRRNKPAYYGAPGDASNTAGQSGASSQSRTYSQQSNYDPLPYQTPPRRNTTGYYNAPGSTQYTSSSANPYYSPSSYSQQGFQGYGKSQGQGGLQGYQHSGSAYPSAASSNIGESSASASSSSLASQSSQTYGGHSLAQPGPGFFESPQQGHTAQGTSSKQGGPKKLAPLPEPRPEWTALDVQMLKCECASGHQWNDIQQYYPKQTLDYYSCLQWIPVEDEHIEALEPESDWNLILPNLRPGRTVEEVQQRHNYLMAKKRPDFRPRRQRSGGAKWSAGEDKILRVAHARGIPSTRYHRELPGRTLNAVRRYKELNVPKWTPLEDNDLRRHAMHQSWAEIARLPEFKGRIPEELEARWEYLKEMRTVPDRTKR